MNEYHDIYGDTYQLSLGHVKTIISRDAKVAEAVLNNEKFEKSILMKKMLKPWFGDSILTSEGDKWHKMRALTNFGFHFKVLESFISIYEKHTEIFIEIIEKEMETSDGLNFMPKIYALTLDIITETLTATTSNAQLNSNHLVIDANEILGEIYEKRLLHGYLAVNWIFRFTKYHKIWSENVTIVNNWIDKIIMERREKLLKDTKTRVYTEESKTKKPSVLIDILLQGNIYGRSLTNSEISNEVKFFISAGYFTTATALSFTVYLLAKHPEEQEKVFKEIKTKIQSGPLTLRDLNSLSYLDNVLKESFRLFPPVFSIVKEPVEDLPVRDFMVPKNTAIILNTYGIQHNEKNFEDPEVFNPDRFNKEYFGQNVFLPFSAGLKNCIGQKYAMFEMKTILVKLVSKFQWRLADKNFKEDLMHNFFVLKFRNGLPLKFQKRPSSQ
ncbi:cytochrome P450 4d2-like [Culicoides brevitarsis]|uniref:cytochrome P450 4d2-like n=1 Tax=Culicoides brevitarsis TaxID=469753 RepID=UPI00307C5643